jgi:hypothetical protein
MEFKVFGTKGCIKCKESIKKLDFFLKKWGINDQVGICFYDMETPEGLAEGAYHEVIKAPTSILMNTTKPLARWDGEIPSAKELKYYLWEVIQDKKNNQKVA